MTSLQALQNDTVEAMCWRHYGRTAGIVEAVLQANPGLVEHGTVLPQGTRVLMPELLVSAPTLQTVKLWD